MSMKSKMKDAAKKVGKKITKAITPTLELPFAERCALFDADYKKLSAKYGIFHNPINIYDDSTVPGGVLKPQVPEEAVAAVPTN